MSITYAKACDVLRCLAAQVDSPLGIKIRLLAENREWEQLQKLDPVDPSDYVDSESYANDALICDFARKSPPVKGDLKHTAVETFFACEAGNKVSNDRLSRYLNRGPFDLQDMAVMNFIDSWRKNVREVLGNLPRELQMKFSPGATVGNRGSKITIPDKIETEPLYYPQTLPLAKYIDCTAWGRVHACKAPKTTGANVFFSVPKDAKKDRGCCKEASGSVVLQLAVGEAIRRRLQAVGIDLDHGQQVHRELARLASVKKHLATIDLSNASDTICKKLVRLILPDAWLTLLESLRAPSTIIDGKKYYLEKFSSMGNGFTFELETLIFLTLAWTVTGFRSQAVKVYGDDIIVPTEVAPDLLAALKFFGFSPNQRKTFVSGSFRESCGGDFFEGTAVRPYYLKTYPTEPQHWIALHNGLRRLGRPRITAAAENYCLQQLPGKIRSLRGPRVLGDAVLHRKPWSVRENRLGWDGIFVQGFVPVPRRLSLAHWSPDVVLASALYGIPSSGVSPRGQVSGYKIATLFVPSKDIGLEDDL